MTLAIKQDSYLRGFRMIEYVAKRIREEQGSYPFLGSYFGSSVTLVPAPLSSPLKDPRALWPAP